MTLLQYLLKMQTNGVSIPQMAKRMKISEKVVRELLDSAKRAA